MFPEILNVVLDVYKSEETISKKNIDNLIDIEWNFDENKTVIKNGVPYDLIDKREIVKQWIKKCFMTSKNTYQTYIVNESTLPFGIPLKNYIGKNIKMNLIISEMKKEIKEMMLKFPYIAEVRDVVVIQIKDKLFIFYTVITTDNQQLIGDDLL